MEQIKQEQPQIAQQPAAQPVRLDNVLLQVVSQVNILSIEFDALFELLADTDEKKQKFKELVNKRMQDYQQKVKSAQIREKLKI